MSNGRIAAQLHSNAAKHTGGPKRSILSLLTEAIVSGLSCTRDKVLIIDSNSAPGKAFEELLRANVLSAPVYDTATRQYIGFLELSDLLRLVVSEYDRAEMIAILARGMDHLDAPHTYKRATNTTVSNHQMHTQSSSSNRKPIAVYIDEILAASQLTATAAAAVPVTASAKSEKCGAAPRAHSANVTPVKPTPTLAKELAVATLAKRHPFVSVPQTATLFDVGKLLCLAAVHRVCVMDESGIVCNVISQSTIIRFLFDNLEHISVEERSRTVEDWHIGSRPVRTVDMCARAIDCFRRMLDLQVSSLTLIDEFGSYIDLVQTADLKIFMSLFFHSTTDATTAVTTAATAANATNVNVSSGFAEKTHAYSSLTLEEPIDALLIELRQLEAAHRIKWTMPSSRLPLAITTITAPTLRDVITRLASTHSHEVVITSRLDDYLQIPLLIVSLGDILRGVFRYVSPSVEAKAIEWVKSVRKATTTAAAAADLLPKAAPKKPAMEGRPFTKLSTIPSSTVMLFRTATQKLATESAALAALENEEALEPALQTVHNAYEAMAAIAAGLPRFPLKQPDKPQTADKQPSNSQPPVSIAPVETAAPTNSKPLDAAAAEQISNEKPTELGAVPVNDQKDSKTLSATSETTAIAKAFNMAFNQCHHAGEHVFSDYGHCLRATRTCARLHPALLSCEWNDGLASGGNTSSNTLSRRFCVFDLGYVGGERVECKAREIRDRERQRDSDRKTQPPNSNGSHSNGVVPASAHAAHAVVTHTTAALHPIIAVAVPSIATASSKL